MTDDAFWKVSWTVRDLPNSHAKCTFDNFVWDREPGIKDEIRSFLQQIGSEDPPSLFLTGDPGTGKTHLAVAAFRWAVYRFDPEQCAFRNVPAFCDRVKESYGNDKQPYRRLERATHLVVLDDIFGRDLSSHERDHILNRLIDMAYTNDAAILTTTNYSIAKIENRMDPHEISRLLRNPLHFEMQSDDFRMRG